MTPRCEAVTFENRQGLTLFGIVHEPAAIHTSDCAVILLSPGVKSRVAPHRLYNKIAAVFASAGLRVLRFDFHGLGDSAGSLDVTLLQDLYGSIQSGRYVGDTLDAIDWMESRYGCRRFILAGLCGGALTGLLAAQHDARVVGLVGLGMPVMLQGSGQDYRRYLTQGQLRGIQAKYQRKLWSAAAWRRLLTFQTDYRLLLRALTSGARHAPPTTTTDDNSNPLFPPALEAVLERHAPVLLVFGDADRLCWEFQEKYFGRYGAALARYREFLELRVLPGANHVFGAPESQTAMLALVETWGRERFGLSASPMVVPAMGERAASVI